ncbi:NAD(P)/FAD-dependent oxidoreductase [Planosporangium flavigriseum]|uniref:NADH dehydrogenase n=1 Tax=Planosporangium flavigriseum TaxID=373681 RepID=A0A8J3PNP5_9ACTN|nr:NAD(P)/FAD-dependent oxidoreductase [Planosporangium flavigriseum]NJC66419.1 NAD(P)/FAD-dependent oxidoreductase [Planosporangium flavigriseum]GIG74171.1 NADH dehydrogenase [Planosporangium flavigriseum]
MTRDATPRVLIVGGGHLGLYAARHLQKHLRPGEAELILADPRSHMTYQPLLPEVAGGNIEPRNIVIPLRRVLPRFRVLNAEVVELRHAERRARLRLVDGEEHDLQYDHVVVGPGSVVRTLPVPGLPELAVGFKTLAEAVYLRNQVLTQLGLAASTFDPRVKRRALTFVLAGGGYAGVEALGELSDMSYAVVDAFGLRREELRWILVEAAGRIMPEVSPELSEYTANVLRRRGVEIRLHTTISSCVGGRIRFGAGLYADEIIESNTLIWTAGVRPNPMLDKTDLPRDDKGRVVADAYLRVRGMPGAWAGGDCAAVPDLTGRDPNALCPPTAQHAVRQARRLADNLISDLRGPHGHPPQPFRHRHAGSVAGLGRFQGVAEVYHVRMRGLPAWLLHRGYHWALLPSPVRKARVLAGWTLDSVFPRDIVASGELEQPRRPLQVAARVQQPLAAGRA